jgi:hypothetical protein
LSMINKNHYINMIYWCDIVIKRCWSC